MIFDTLLHKVWKAILYNLCQIGYFGIKNTFTLGYFHESFETDTQRLQGTVCISYNFVSVQSHQLLSQIAKYKLKNLQPKKTNLVETK